MTFQVTYPYFEEAEPVEDSQPGSYADPTAIEELPGRPTYGWNHGLGEIVGALARPRGMRLDHLEEHDWTSFLPVPWLVADGRGGSAPSPPGRLRVPLSFTLLATRV